MKHALALAVLAASCSAPAFAATNVFVSTTQTQAGCAARNSTPGYFQATSFSFGGSEPSVSSGAGAGAGKLTLQNLVISKLFDGCSGTLITQFISDAPIPEVTLLERTTVETTSGPTTTTPLTITLTNARINSYSLTGSGGGAGQENINFTFEKACITAVKSDSKTPTKVCYDSSTNAVQ